MNVEIFQMTTASEAVPPMWSDHDMVNDAIMEEIFQRPGLFIQTHKAVPLEALKTFIDTQLPHNGKTLLTQACIRNQLGSARTLIRWGRADVEQPGLVYVNGKYANLTPLCCAAAKGNMPMVLYLIETSRASPHTQTPQGATALYCASRNNHLEVMEYLIAQGADVNKRLGDNTTALMWACKQGQLQAAQLLIKHGALVLPADNEGNTALHHAAGQSNTALVLLLKQAGATEPRNSRGLTPTEVAGWSGTNTLYTLLPNSGSQEEKIRACKLRTARCAISNNYPEATRWRTKYRNLMDTPDTEIPTDPGHPIAQALQPLLSEAGITTSLTQQQYWQQRCVLILMEILGPYDPDTLEQLHAIGSTTYWKGSSYKSLMILRLTYPNGEGTKGTPECLAN
jgi:ankyrin repeat protein